MKASRGRIEALGAAVLLVAGVVLLAVLWPAAPREYEEIRIDAGGHTLAGYLSIGEDPAGPYVVFVHGNRSSGQAHPLYQALRALIRSKATVLAIDMRGFGQSSFVGSPGDSDGVDRLTDLEAALAYLRGEFGVRDDQVVWIGHSLGAVEVLRVATTGHFRKVIAIGPSDFDLFLSPAEARRDYIAKYYRNTGIRLADSAFLEQASRLVPEALFEPCPATKEVLIFGQRDVGQGLNLHSDSIPLACRESIDWDTIPLADHMYGTEDDRLPPPISGLMSTLFVKMLAWDINRQLGE